MNVYDFDGTIYSGDSTIDFYFFVLRRHPLLVRYAFLQAWGMLLYFCRLISKTRCKEYFFTFLRSCEAGEEAVLFWQSHEYKIQNWYLSQKKPDDVIISASPEFLLRPVCSALGITLIASQTDPASGLFTGNNCRGEEKVFRFEQTFGRQKIENFYSDSPADLPLARRAQNAYLVNRGKTERWKFNEPA